MTETAAAEPNFLTDLTKKRSITVRRGLPNGRALVGALLITVAMVAAFLFANRSDGGPAVQYLVLNNDIKSGTLLSQGDYDFVPLTLSAELDALAFTQDELQGTQLLAGATALRFLHAGSLLLAPDLRLANQSTTASPEVHELTLPVPLNRSPSYLKQGDRVTILAHDTTNLDFSITKTALQDALVLDFVADGSSSVGILTVSLEDAETVMRATHLSFLELTVVLTTRSQNANYLDQYPQPSTAALLGDTDIAPLSDGELQVSNGEFSNER